MPLGSKNLDCRDPYLGLISIYVAHLWFRPIILQAREGEYTFWGAMESIFLRSDVREIVWNRRGPTRNHLGL